jgi:hypothetical protein
MNAKLTPSVFFMFDHTNDANFITPAVSYIFDRHWTFTAGAFFFNGEEAGKSFHVFKHKDYFFLKAVYKWG